MSHYESGSPVRAGPSAGMPAGAEHVTRDRQRNVLRRPDGTIAVQEREVVTIWRWPWAPHQSAASSSWFSWSGLLNQLADLAWFVAGIHRLVVVGIIGGLIAHAVGRSEVLGYLGAFAVIWFFFIRAKG